MIYIYCKPSTNVTEILTETHETPFTGLIKRRRTKLVLCSIKYILVSDHTMSIVLYIK